MNVYEDEVIREVWRNRDAYAAEHHYNLDEIVADLQARREELINRLLEIDEDETVDFQDAGSLSYFTVPERKSPNRENLKTP